MSIAFRGSLVVCLLGLCTLFISSASGFDQSSFIVHPVALTSSDGPFGPQLGSGMTFTGFNGDASIGGTGEVAYPGDLVNAAGVRGEGFWLNRGGENTAIVLTSDDGPLGPGLGSGVVFNNTFHDALAGASGEVLTGGFLAGPGVDSTNDLAYVRHRGNANFPVARTGVANALGPGLSENVVFSLFGSAQINADSVVALQARIAGPGISPAASEGLWRNTSSGNVAFVRAGVGGLLGPNIGTGVTFGNQDGYNAFEQFQLIDGSDDVVFVGRTIDELTSMRSLGIWRNSAAGNAPIALSNVTNDLGPGLGPNVSFGGRDQSSFGSIEFDTNIQGDTVFSASLSDERRGFWRNDGQRNEPVMLEGETGDLGPGAGINDTFANFNRTILLPEPDINDANDVLFPGLLSNSGQRGLWVNSGDENRAIALTGDDGGFGPGLGPGVFFTEFNRAYFGSDDTVYFTANLSYNVRFNRNLGLWAYRNGRIQPIAVYDELFDVDPTTGFDSRRVEWVQIPSDFTWNNDYGANDLNQLVFRIGFQDGTRGVFLAMPVPEPASGLLLIAMLLPLACFRSA